MKAYALYAAWFVSLIALLGSLYFSEVAHFAPCRLCWYQRGLVIGILLVLTVGIIQRAVQTPLYAFPLAVAGMGISAYHNLLSWNVIGEATGSSCQIGVSCTARYIEWFGFVTIPLLSLLTFTLLAGLLIAAYVVIPQS